MRPHIEPPCDCHPADWVGTVSAGDLHVGAHCSVVTCADHVTQSQGYVQMVAGLPASPLLTFEEARR